MRLISNRGGQQILHSAIDQVGRRANTRANEKWSDFNDVSVCVLTVRAAAPVNINSTSVLWVSLSEIIKTLWTCR